MYLLHGMMNYRAPEAVLPFVALVPDGAQAREVVVDERKEVAGARVARAINPIRLWALECGDIPADTPRVDAIRTVIRTGPQDPPVGRGWAIDCDVGLSISVVVGRDRNVVGEPPPIGVVRAVIRTGPEDPPRAGGRTIDRNVGPTIPVVMAGTGMSPVSPHP